jgi:hypothetical protein
MVNGESLVLKATCGLKPGRSLFFYFFFSFDLPTSFTIKLLLAPIVVNSHSSRWCGRRIMSMQSAASPPLVGFTELLSAVSSSINILIGGGLFGFDISSMSGVLGTEAYQNYFGHRK